MSAVSNAGPLRQVQFTGVSADETAGQWIDVSAYRCVSYYVKGTGTTSSGVVTIEEIDYDPKTKPVPNQTASLIQDVNASDVTGGAQKAVHLSPAAYAFQRARISTVIGGGGTVEVVLRAS